MNAKERSQLLYEIADKVSAYRQSYGRQSLKRINVSTALYKLLTDKEDSLKDGFVLFGIKGYVYNCDKLEYSFSSEVFEINTGKKEE